MAKFKINGKNFVIIFALKYLSVKIDNQLLVFLG